jgi:AbrB family looped-hinge helix DNA binding protein
VQSLHQDRAVLPIVGRLARELSVLDQGPYPCYGKDMAKVTSKLQVTIPKVIADRFDIRPGDEIEWKVEGGVIRVLPQRPGSEVLGTEERLRLFDLATARQRERERETAEPAPAPAKDRGWTREDLYRRGGGD